MNCPHRCGAGAILYRGPVFPYLLNNSVTPPLFIDAGICEIHDPLGPQAKEVKIYQRSSPPVGSGIPNKGYSEG